MRPIVDKTLLFKDENGNLAIAEESLHKMFVGLARVDNNDPTKRLYLYEKDMIKKMPPLVQRYMKERNPSTQA